MKKTNNKIVSTIVLVIFFLAFVALAHRNGQTLTHEDSNQNIQEIETHDLSKYTDDVFGISFQYPSSWKLEEALYEEYRGIDIINPGVGLITISKQSKSEEMTPKQWFEMKRETQYNTELIQEIAEKKILNSEALMVGQPQTCKTAGMIVVIIDQGDNMLVIDQMEMGEVDTVAALELKGLLQTLETNKEKKSSTDEISVEDVTFPEVPSNITIECS